MKRDMELIRKILIEIEKKYQDTWLSDNQIEVEGYCLKSIGYHCALLHDAGLVADYKGFYADNELKGFGVGRLTWEGHELLDKIKSETVWTKTKDVMKKNAIPFVLEAVREVATTIVAGMIQGAIKGMAP